MTTQGLPTELFIHHSDTPNANRIDTVAEQHATLRSFQNFHMDTRGWSDIGYHLICFQPYGGIKQARLYRGRPIRYVPAAQQGHNTGTIALCVVSANDPVKDRTVDRIDAAIRALAEKYPLTRVRAHGDVFATDCPGSHLRALLPHFNSTLRKAR